MFIKKKTTLSNAEISAFCEQLSMIITAGLPTYEGISILLEDASDKDTKALLTTIYEPLEKGSSFSSALVDCGAFPKYMTDMIALGEETGNLDDVLSSLTAYYEREASIKSGIKNAVTYPLIMIVMMLGVILVLMTQVLPIFHQIYEELGTELTGVASILISISNALNQYLGFFILLIVLLVFLAIFLIRSSMGKILFHGKGLYQKISASRFANCMALALGSGLDTDYGLELALSLVDNPIMEEKIRKCQESLSLGHGFADSLLDAGIFEKIYTSFITIGFRTGSMDKVMKKISKEYENEIDLQIGRFISILEPSLVILLSVIVGVILLSFLLPLIGIMTNIG